MAEFQVVLREAKRMCGQGCIYCPFDGSENLCNATSPLCYADKFDPEVFEEAVMKWAKERPAKRYPTWREWLNSISMRSSSHAPTPCNFIDCHKEGECRSSLCPYLDNEIPEEFAIKANIKPIEKKIEEKKAGGFTFD